MREVWLVRHGESESNAKRTWQGQGDSKLSARGEQQAQRLAERLRGVPFDVAVSSDLERAAKTALALDSSINSLELNAQWREIDVGAWEGLTMAEVAQRFPKELVAITNRDPVKIGGGESWPELAERTDAALAQILNRLLVGQRAIVFAHGAVIGAVLSGLAQQRHVFPSTLGHVSNSAITKLRFSDTVELIAHNDDTHADDVRSVDPWGAEMSRDTVRLIAAEHGAQLPRLHSELQSAAETSGEVVATCDAFATWITETLAGAQRKENEAGPQSATTPPTLHVLRPTVGTRAVVVPVDRRRCLLSLHEGG